MARKGLNSFSNLIRWFVTSRVYATHPTHTHHYTHTHAGVLFSGVSVIEASCTLLASVIYNALFPVTVKVHPGLCFFIMAASLVVPFILIMWVVLYRIAGNFRGYKCSWFSLIKYVLRSFTPINLIPHASMLASAIPQKLNLSKGLSAKCYTHEIYLLYGI